MARGTARLDTAVYKDASAFAALREEWHALLPHTNCNTVFCTPEWLASWWRSFGLGRPLHVVTIRDDGVLLGVAPLMQSVEGGKRCRCFIGGLDVSDYFDLLSRAGGEARFLAAFLDHLEADADWDVVDLHSIPAGSPSLTVLPELARSRGYMVSVEQEEVCPVVELPATWDAYLESLSKKDRHELRRKLRRLEAETSWVWRTVVDAGDLPRAMDDFFDLHVKSGIDKAGFWDDARRAFFRDNAEAMLKLGWLHLSFLELEGVRAAAIFAYDYDGTVGLYNSGYDPAYRYYSVGVLLVALGLREAIAGGKTRFDFLRGNEPYKYTFGAKDVAVHNVTIWRDGGDCRG